MKSDGSSEAAEGAGPSHPVVERLLVLLREENAALRDMDFGRAGALLQAKYAAAGALEAAFRTGGTNTMPDEQAHALAKLAQENKALLQRAARIQKRVFSLVARVAAPKPKAPEAKARRAQDEPALQPIA